jgi:hypothetical protein
MSLTPEERRELIEQGRETRRALRLVLNRALVVLYVIGMVLLVMMLRAAQDSLQRTFIYVVMVIATAWILSNPLRDDPILARLRELADDRRKSPPSSTPDAAQETPEQGHDVQKSTGETDFASLEPGSAQGGQPAERRRIEDLAELPPEMASNPDFQKFFEEARKLGGHVSVRASGPVPQGSGDVQNLPPGIAANPDVQEMVEDARALGGRVEITRLGARKVPSFARGTKISRVTGLPDWVILILLSVLAALALTAFGSFIARSLAR